MKKSLFILSVFALCAASVRAQPPASQGEPEYGMDIEQVDVVATRPMKETGIQQTRLDTAVLHENVALSMADILAYNSTVFVKSYGRGTLATVSFRGTSASHTQVTWNGMKINSPMLGMTDFSMIPSYFIDAAALLHGPSSVSITGGGLGGAVVLSTEPLTGEGWGLRFIQGIGSWDTYDEYLRFTYGSGKWRFSTRAVYTSSDNNFKYRNYHKKTNLVFDEDYNLVDFEYPVERNRNCSFRDLHVLQEAYFNSGKGDRISLAAWYVHSDRGVPMLSVDHRKDAEFDNEQRERTLRAAASWERIRGPLRFGLHGGYIRTETDYDYSRDKGNGVRADMIRSRSRINTAYAKADAEYAASEKWLFTAGISLHQHFVRSADRNIITRQGGSAVVGYDKARPEVSADITVRWKPAERVGLSAVLRGDMYGHEFTPPIPAFYADWVVSRRGNITLKVSASRNYRYPTLNDLYFLPGGNDSLRSESGFSYDGGISFSAGNEKFTLRGEATAFDSYIRNWIIWLPTAKGFWSPHNVKEVHAYGVELKGKAEICLARGLRLCLDGLFSWNPSINRGDPVNRADESIGKQLVYVPLYQAAVTGRLSWKGWTFMYKWCYYSERYTTSSNTADTEIGRVLPYYMSDVSLEKRFRFRSFEFSVKAVVKNLWDEWYESVLSHPMPRQNYQILLELYPFGKKSSRRH